jgi:hypothetical protein
MIRWPADLTQLQREFRRAKPFAHAVLDGAVAPADHAQLAQAFADEPQTLVENEIYLHLRGPEPPMTPALRGFCDALQASCAQVSAICGQRLSRVDGSAYVYLEGHYLLPHSDSRKSEGRAIAYAYYVSAPLRGGELELFACTRKGGEIVRTRPVKRIAAHKNRLVLFAVNDVALHRVREVLDGARTSVAGWFYP